MEKKLLQGVPTIDVELVVIRTDELEIAIDTSNQIGVEPQVETTDAIRLMKLGRLLAQKNQRNVITGHQITLTDNLFYLELMVILQGGEVVPNEDETLPSKYLPPIVGTKDEGIIFELDAYSAVYDTSGEIMYYEKITYPSCKGTPVTINTQDDTFRIPQYVINSAPRRGQRPYEIDYVKELPVFEVSDTRMTTISKATGVSTI